MGQCVAKGLASGRLVGTDSTHVKANASWASEELVELPESPGVYWERLDTYEEEGLEELERRTGKTAKEAGQTDPKKIGVRPGSGSVGQTRNPDI